MALSHIWKTEIVSNIFWIIVDELSPPLPPLWLQHPDRPKKCKSETVASWMWAVTTCPIKNLLQTNFGITFAEIFYATEKRFCPSFWIFHPFLFSQLTMFRIYNNHCLHRQSSKRTCSLCRSSPQRRSINKGVLKYFAKFTGKHLCQCLFFNKVAGLYQKRDSCTGVFLWVLQNS